jgi:hypothetical protein
VLFQRPRAVGAARERGGVVQATLNKVTAPQTLDLLFEDIRRHHKAVERHAQKMVAEAIAAGELLIQAKDELRHGEFGAFLVRCGVNARSARVYMRLARNSGSAAILEAKSIRSALEAIAGPCPKPRQLSLGPPCPPSHAGSRQWQAGRWAEAILAQGRPADEIRGRPGVRWCEKCDRPQTETGLIGHVCDVMAEGRQ